MGIPAWFDTVRADIEEARRAAQHEVDERDAKLAERQRRVAAAERHLPASEAAHAPFRQEVAAAKEAEHEARQRLWRAEADLRISGPLHRRSARGWSTQQLTSSPWRPTA